MFIYHSIHWKCILIITTTMTDIFDTKILCKKCNTQMNPIIVNRNGLELRAVECPNCHDKIIHPADLNGLEQFKDLREKKFNVKLRMVGNSHAISIPKQIIDFINERHKETRKEMDDMVSLCFDDFDTLKLSFDDALSGNDELNPEEVNYDDGKNRVNRRIVNDGKGNIDIVEEQSLNNNGNQIRRVKIKKIRRNFNG